MFVAKFKDHLDILKQILIPEMNTENKLNDVYKHKGYSDVTEKERNEALANNINFAEESSGLVHTLIFEYEDMVKKFTENEEYQSLLKDSRMFVIDTKSVLQTYLK